MNPRSTSSGLHERSNLGVVDPFEPRNPANSYQTKLSAARNPQNFYLGEPSDCVPICQFHTARPRVTELI
jgi:hypothetical protein